MSQIVVDNSTDRNVALANSAAIDAMIATAPKNYVELPQGTITLETPPALRSGIDLVGARKQGTVLRMYAGGWETPIRSFSRIGYTMVSDIAKPLEVGEWMFEFRYFDEPPPDGLGNLCRKVRVTAIGKASFTTSPPKDSRCNAYQRFWRTWDITIDPKAGDLFLNVASPVGVTVGSYLWITPGPRQNAGRGFFRRVENVENSRVWLDRPIPYDLGPSLACDIVPLTDCAVRDVRIDPGSFLWSVGVKGAVNFKLEGVNFGQGNVQIISSGGFEAADCRGGAFELNTTTESVIRNCKATYLYGEEDTHDLTVLNTLIGPTRRGYPQNNVTGFYFCDRWKFRGVTVEAAGQPVWGYPTASFSTAGKDHDYEDIDIRLPIITNNQGPWAGFGGDNLRLSHVENHGTAMQVSKGQKVYLDQIRGVYIQVLSGSSGVASFCDAIDFLSPVGWQVFGVPAPSRADMQALAAPFAREPADVKEPPKPVFRHTQNAQPGNSTPKG